MFRNGLSGLICSVVVLSGCLESTQVTFDIKTDVPCADVSGVNLTVGLAGQTEKATPVKTSRSCTADGKVAVLGTYAVTPKSGTKEVVASIKVALAVGSSLNVDEDCTAAKGYAGCIVARRRISFLPRRSLTVPIDMLLICKDVQCDENSTCSKAGKCITSLIDVTRCSDDGVCEQPPATRAGDGLPCFNEGTASPLFCSGDSAWCTRGPSGMRACSAGPLPNGISYQCRNAQDCGPNLQCVIGGTGVLGQCVTMPKADQTVLCTFGEPVTPCPTGPFGCAVDAGFGLTSCLPLDAGMKPGRDGGLPCPRTGDLTCFAPTPYCQTLSGTPTCVSDGGAQCWYPSDCPAGNSCYAGLQGQFFNACLPAANKTNPVQLCNEKLDGGDCPTGFACDGQFYGFRACRNLNPPVVTCPPGSDAGLRCGDATPYCRQNDDAGYECSASLTGGTGTRSWACTDARNCQPGERCVYQRSATRQGGLIAACAPIQTDAGQAVACTSVNECDPGRTCGPAVGEDGLSLCTNASHACDRNFFSSNPCSMGGNCCSVVAMPQVCTANRAACTGQSGTPWECDSAVQCGAHQMCAHLNPGYLPDLPTAGIVCVDIPADGGQLFVRNIHCQPETKFTDCPPQYPACEFLANTGAYVCRAADAGIAGPGGDINVSNPWR